MKPMPLKSFFTVLLPLFLTREILARPCWEFLARARATVGNASCLPQELSRNAQQFGISIRMMNCFSFARYCMDPSLITQGDLLPSTFYDIEFFSHFFELTDENEMPDVLLIKKKNGSLLHAAVFLTEESFIHKQGFEAPSVISKADLVTYYDTHIGQGAYTLTKIKVKEEYQRLFKSFITSANQAASAENFIVN